jgi:hypothetical protein
MPAQKVARDLRARAKSGRWPVTLPAPGVSAVPYSRRRKVAGHQDGTVTGSAPETRGRGRAGFLLYSSSPDGTVTGSAPETLSAPIRTSLAEPQRGIGHRRHRRHKKKMVIAEAQRPPKPNVGGVLRTPIWSTSPCLPSCPSCSSW